MGTTLALPRAAFQWYGVAMRIPLAALAATLCMGGLAHAAVRRFPADAPWTAGKLSAVTVQADGLALAPEAPRGTFAAPRVTFARAYDRLVPSWNARTATGGRVVIEVRPFRAGAPLSDWLTIARWSKNERGARDAGAGAVTIDQDTVKVAGGADAVELRATLERGAGGAPTLQALGVTAFASDGHTSPEVTSTGGSDIRYPVPYRSQRDADRAISGRICGPTSLSMALAYNGVVLKTEEVAALAKDPAGDIAYGNWAYLAATAAELGLDADVRAFGSLDEVVRELAVGHLVILALQFKRGELPGAPISQTAGHLVLARGYDADGNIHVNDPAGHGPKDGQVRYARASLATAWKRGIGIVLKRF